MEVLQDIAYAITRYQAREIEVLTNPNKNSSKQDNRYWEFYVNLRDNQWRSDEEAARYFGMEYPSKNYNRLKNDTMKRLLNSVLFTDMNSPDFNDFKRANQELVRLWAIAEMLRKKGAHKAFLELSGKCLDNAIKFENLEMIISISRILKLSTLPRPNLKKTYLVAEAAFNKYWPAFLAEVEIQNAYENLVQQVIYKKGYKKEFAPLAESWVKQYSEQAGQFPYIQFQYYYKILEVYSKVLKHDWPGGLRVADEALAFYYSKPFLSTVPILSFSHQKMACLTMLGKYEEAKRTGEEALKIAVEGTPLWFKNREITTVNALYADNYAEAWQLTRMAMRHERFCEISMFDQESWRLYQGYLHFLAQIGEFQLSSREKGEMPRFRLSTWLNDLPLYSQDKRGANIPVLILQALFLLLEHNWDGFDQRVEALRKYRQRNLQPEKEHFRTDCFIRLLELIPANAYKPGALQSVAAPLLGKLQSVSVDILDRTFEIEVVPYEQQWAWIMKILEMSRVAPPRVSQAATPAR